MRLPHAASGDLGGLEHRQLVRLYMLSGFLVLTGLGIWNWQDQKDKDGLVLVAAQSRP
jgi:hypothetical protein